MNLSLSTSMSENDKQRQRLFDFLIDNIPGRERDAVTRAIYEVAEGDPHSYPVGMATLLIACARQMAHVPENVRSNVTELRTLAAQIIEFERDLIGKMTGHDVELMTVIRDTTQRMLANFREENAHVITAFKEQVASAQDSRKYLDWSFERVGKIYERLSPIVDASKQIAKDFKSLEGELKLHEESHRKALDAVATLEVIQQASATISQRTQTLIESLTGEARANWVTLGLFAGILLTAMFSQLPWWGAFLAFVVSVILLRWLSSL
jgi:uncharacterized damage-inducible protein DinB